MKLRCRQNVTCDVQNVLYDGHNNFEYVSFTVSKSSAHAHNDIVRCVSNNKKIYLVSVHVCVIVLKQIYV